MNSIFHRVSIRKYQEKKIEQEMSAISLQSIIDGIQVEANH